MKPQQIGGVLIHIIFLMIKEIQNESVQHTQSQGEM